MPIFVVPQPYPNERVFDAAGRLRHQRAGAMKGRHRPVNTAIDRAFAEIGSVEVLHQPADTVAHGFTTARAFSRDAVRVDGDTAQHAEDLLHVGAAYGARVLERVYAGLRHGIAA